MLVKEFVEKFIQHNSLVRLWYKEGNIYSEVIEGDKPMMEHELVKSEYNDREVIGITDILYEKSFYIEAINLVIKERDVKKHRLNSIKKLKS